MAVGLAAFELLGEGVDLIEIVPRGVEAHVAALDERDQFLKFGVLAAEGAAVTELAVDERL
jgi:hypothetical protein